MMLSRTGRHAEAIAAHRTAIAEAAHDHGALVNATFNLGQALFRQGDMSAAIATLEQAVALEKAEPTHSGLLKPMIKALKAAQAAAR